MGRTLSNRKMSPDEYVAELIRMMECHEQRGLAKAITEVDSFSDCREALLDYAYRKEYQPTLVVGITGPGGVGKSTLTDKLIKQYRAQNKTVGVLAVDPSSPYSGGAFLGDRVRMEQHNRDSGVFMRSFGSRGSQGGISEGAKDALYLYKAFGFDVILLESLGVGQDETEINLFVDVNALLLVPGLGDIMQMFKAGVREAADVFIINKSDKPEAIIVKEMLENSFGIMPPELRPPIVMTVASEDKGIDDVVAAVAKQAERQKQFTEQKAHERIKAEISASIINLVRKEFEPHIEEITQQVLKESMTPFEASGKMVERITITSDGV